MTSCVDKKSQHSNRKPISKTIGFYAIACAIPVLFFIALEGGLRLIGYGKDAALFIDNPANHHYILPHPNVMTRYFPDSAPKPNVTLEANFLLKHKPDNGVRIFVQGGSTAAGFPYGYGASLAATLDQRLKQTLVGKHVEVVSTALSAVNSYTLLDFADEIIEQQPDAVLIYAGHNEFLGILGVGSNYAIANASQITLWFLRLKKWRTFQLVQQLFFASQAVPVEIAEPSETAKEFAQSRTFMSQVAKQKHIVFGDDIFIAGVKQFERNMRLLINKYQEANIPVFIGTLASNHKDQSPFSSLAPSTKHIVLFEQLKTQNETMIGTGLNEQWQRASEVFKSSPSASLHYSVAQTLEHQRLAALAKAHYVLAIEHDLLRFRAPQAMNKIIKTLASEPGVYLVDSLLAFEQRSKNGIVSNSLMLEHLHPNLQGYFVLSDSFYQALAASDLFTPWTDVPIAQAWQQRLVLPAEEYFGFATVQKLLSDYPFTDAPVAVILPQPSDWQQEAGKQWFEKRTDWQSMMQQSLLRYRSENNTEMAFKTLQILADALPHNGLYNLQLAEQMLKKNRLNEALHYYQRAKLAGAVDGSVDRNIGNIQRRIIVENN